MSVSRWISADIGTYRFSVVSTLAGLQPVPLAASWDAHCQWPRSCQAIDAVALAASSPQSCPENSLRSDCQPIRAVSGGAGQSLAIRCARFLYSPSQGKCLFAHSTQITQSSYPGARWIPYDGRPNASACICSIDGFIWTVCTA